MFTLSIGVLVTVVAVVTLLATPTYLAARSRRLSIGRAVFWLEATPAVAALVLAVWDFASFQAAAAAAKASGGMLQCGMPLLGAYFLGVMAFAWGVALVVAFFLGRAARRKRSAREMVASMGD